MKKNIKQDIGCFTADFRDEKVVIGKKAFPAGYFFMNALNEYQKEAPDGRNSDPGGDWLIANRIIINHIDMWQLRDDITIGYLDKTKAKQIHEDIQYILGVISSAKPFVYLTLETEKKRCKKLLGEESVKRIILFLKERAQHTLKSGDYWMSGGRPDTEEIRRLEKERAHFEDYLTTLDYYYKLGDDMNTTMDFGKGFVKQLAALEKRDESNLIVLAMKCLQQAPFERWHLPFQNTLSPNVEYLAIPKKADSKNYIVGKRMTFVRFLDFLIADFFEGVHVGHYPQLCEN